MKVVCINDSNRPNEISINNWVKKGDKYTPIKLCISKLTKEKYYVFEEIQTGNTLYGGYNVNRFSIDLNSILVGEKELEEEYV